MHLTVAFITGRHQPQLRWLLDGLRDQRHPDDVIELVAVDALGRPLDELANETSAVDVAIAVPVKPNIWQGSHRITTCDWWAVANARNTALVYATAPYVAFCDDRCRIGPRWLDTVRAGAASSAIIAGAYEKHEDGRVTKDHRLSVGPRGKRGCVGGWLFGGTFALPLDVALSVNGVEEGMDGLGFEDVVFGMMLSNAGYRLDYVPDMFVSQERSVAAFGPTYKKTDKGVSPNDKSHAALKRFGTRRRTEFTPDLVALRARDKTQLPIPDPNAIHLDWYDNQPINGLG